MKRQQGKPKVPTAAAAAPPPLPPFNNLLSLASDSLYPPRASSSSCPSSSSSSSPRSKEEDTAVVREALLRANLERAQHVQVLAGLKRELLAQSQLLEEQLVAAGHAKEKEVACTIQGNASSGRRAKDDPEKPQLIFSMHFPPMYPFFLFFLLYSFLFFFYILLPLRFKKRAEGVIDLNTLFHGSPFGSLALSVLMGPHCSVSLERGFSLPVGFLWEN